MEIFTVSLFGHREITNPFDIESALVKEVNRLIRAKEYVEFLIGRNGEFDILAAAAIRRTQKKLDFRNSALVLVLPGSAKSTADLKRYYDEIEICGEDCHFKAALQTRNRMMIDHSDLVICCIEHQSGGAYQTVKYAQKQHKTIINLAEGFG